MAQIHAVSAAHRIEVGDSGYQRNANEDEEDSAELLFQTSFFLYDDNRNCKDNESHK